MKELTMSEVEEVSGGRGRRRSGNRPSGGFKVSKTFQVIATVAVVIAAPATIPTRTLASIVLGAAVAGA